MIKLIEKSSEKAEITNQILRSLPEWFGIESSIVEYVENVQKMPFWAVYDDNIAVGFIARAGLCHLKSIKICGEKQILLC